MRTKIQPGNIRPMLSIIAIYWLTGLAFALSIPNSANSDVVKVISTNLGWLHTQLPAVKALAASSEIPIIAECFFLIMWALFPVFMVFLYMKLPEIAEPRSLKMLQGLLACLSTSAIIFWFLGLHAEPYDINEVPISRGAPLIYMMTSNRLGLSIVGTLFIVATGITLAISIKCAAKLIAKQSLTSSNS